MKKICLVTLLFLVAILFETTVVSSIDTFDVRKERLNRLCVFTVRGLAQRGHLKLQSKMQKLNLLFEKTVQDFCRGYSDFYYQQLPPLEEETFLFLSLAIVEKESGFNPYVISKRNAIGLFQVHYDFWKKKIPGLRKEDLKDPYYNTLLGLWILKHNLEIYGSLSKSLKVYFAGSNYRRSYKVKLKADRYASSVIERAFVITDVSTRLWETLGYRL